MPMALKKQSSWETSGLITGTRAFALGKANKVFTLYPCVLHCYLVHSWKTRLRDHRRPVTKTAPSWIKRIDAVELWEAGGALVAARRGDTSTTYELCMSCSAWSTSKCQSVWDNLSAWAWFWHLQSSAAQVFPVAGALAWSRSEKI